MVAGEALGVIGRQIMSHFPLSSRYIGEICQHLYDEIAGLVVFLLHLGLLPLLEKVVAKIAMILVLQGLQG